MNLSHYTVFMFASHSVFHYVMVHIEKLKGIEYNRYVIADAGLLPDERGWIQENLPRVSFLDLQHRNEEAGIVTQSEEYREIIRQRPHALFSLFQDSDDPVLQIDADTAIMSNNFDMVNPRSDITLTVREVGPGDHCLDGTDAQYPNLGVVFWNHPQNCISFIKRWISVQDNEEPLKQYEQGNFYRAMQSEEFTRLRVQRVHCRYLNCYHKQWYRESHPSIVHFKGYGTMKIQDILEKP